MQYKTILLKDMIEEIGEEETRKILSDFSCPLDQDIEEFVEKKAVDFEKAGISRTYLVYAIENRKSYFSGLYSLSQKPLFFDEKLTKKEKRKYYGTTFSVASGIVGDPMLSPNEKYVQSILLGQLSKNYYNGNDKLITGDILINLAFSRIIELYRLGGGITIHLDCQNKPALKKFYEKHGFHFYKERKTKENVFLIYVTPIKSLIASVNEMNHLNIEESSIMKLRKSNFRGVIEKDENGCIRKPTV